MSAILLDQVLAHVRSLFTATEVATVQEYGGEFDAAEVEQVSFSAPAVFIAVLGWRGMPTSTRLTGKHVRQYRLGAFIATKHAKRELRMRAAMAIAEKLVIGLRTWAPHVSTPIEIAGLEDEPTAENLFSRGIDKRGMALWLVDWRQCIRPTVPLEQLYDLVAVDIVDTTQQGVTTTATSPAQTPLTVTEEVRFAAPVPT